MASPGFRAIERRIEQLDRGNRALNLLDAAVSFVGTLGEDEFLLWASDLPDLKHHGTLEAMSNPRVERALTWDILRPVESLRDMRRTLTRARQALGGRLDALHTGDDPAWHVALTRLLAGDADAVGDLISAARKLGAAKPGAPAERGLWEKHEKGTRKVKLQTFQQQRIESTPESVGAAETPQAQKLGAIVGRKQVTLKYTGLKEANLTTTLRPSKRTITYSARNPHVQMSGEEAQYVLSSAMAGEWEVVE